MTFRHFASSESLTENDDFTTPSPWRESTIFSDFGDHEEPEMHHWPGSAHPTGYQPEYRGPDCAIPYGSRHPYAYLELSREDPECPPPPPSLAGSIRPEVLTHIWPPSYMEMGFIVDARFDNAVVLNLSLIHI